MGAIAVSSRVGAIQVLPLRTLSDERLAELAGAGHSDALGTLYERYREALSRYCRSIVHDAEDANDALQNTMVSVLRALHGHGPSGPVRPWLYRIAHNESVSIIRRRHDHERLSPDTPGRSDPALASLIKDRLNTILNDLRSLPESQRDALIMRVLGGLEYAEIAAALNLTPISARRHVFEARVGLREIAAGRETDCGEIVRRISDGDGRVLRARSVRGHLRGCSSCSAFERRIRTRPETLRLVSNSRG
jgi:RNA polymerase sigma factor (sigma-70 family)